MDFSLAGPDARLIDELRDRFAGIAARATIADTNGVIPRRNWRDLAELGYPLLLHRAELGGRDLDGATQVLAMEALASACPSTFWSATMSALVCVKLIDTYGDPDTHRPLVDALLHGQRLGCFAVVERTSGSDANTYTTTVVRDGDGYTISGEKARITNATTADLAVVLARLSTSDSNGPGWCYAFVDLRAPGVRSYPLPHMGLRAMPWGGIVFDRVRVEPADVVPIRLDQFPEGMAWGWLFISVAAIAMAESALAACVSHVRNQVAFGRPLAHMEGVQAALADMRAEIDAARLLACRCGWHRTEGRLVQDLVGALKPYATEMAVRVVERAVQLHGAVGLTPGHPVERIYRDAPMNVIGGFASNRLRELVAADLGLAATYQDFTWLAPTGLATNGGLRRPAVAGERS